MCGYEIEITGINYHSEEKYCVKSLKLHTELEAPRAKDTAQYLREQREGFARYWNVFSKLRFDESSNIKKIPFSFLFMILAH